MNKKAEITQIFIYMMALIIVVFIGYLVVKFVFAFTSDSSEIFDVQFYEAIESDYEKVFRTFNGESIFDYKVQSKIENIAFLGNCIESDLSDEEKIIVENGDNIVVYTSSGIYSSYKIGEYLGCFDTKPNSNGRFKLAIENRRNQVFITEID